MKKLYLLTLFLTVANLVFAQNFTEGNLVLFRHNLEGATSGGNNTNGTKSVGIFLDEYKLAADGNSLELVQSLPLYNTMNGINNPITTFGWDHLEGYMTRSYDGRYLIVPGYGVPAGTELASSYSTTAASRAPRESLPKTIALVNYQKNINSETLLPASIFSNRSFIGATSFDGTDLWLSGGWGGTSVIDGPYYAATGATTAVNLLSNSNRLLGTRAISIFNHQLYAIEGWTSTSSASAWNFHKIGSGMPKTNSPENAKTLENLGVAAAFIDMQAVFMAKLPNGKTVIYVANAYPNGETIRKYSQKADGTYVNNYTNSGTFRGKDGVGAPVAIDGKVDPATGKVTLYIVSSTRNTAGGNSKVYMLEDEAGHNETAAAGQITGTPKLLLDISGENKQFRSIAWAPVQVSVLPIKLSFFDAKHENDRVQVKWATSSETNNSHFEVLRSDGSEFKVIGTIKGAGNSEEEKSYSFVDSKPLNGVSYYQLRQVDFDGNADVSKIVPINISLEQTEIKVQGGVSNQKIEVTVFATKSGNSTIHITDASGKKISSSKIAIQKGNNTFSIPLKLQKTLYVISLITADEKYVTKFIPR